MWRTHFRSRKISEWIRLRLCICVSSYWSLPTSMELNWNKASAYKRLVGAQSTPLWIRVKLLLCKFKLGCLRFFATLTTNKIELQSNSRLSREKYRLLYAPCLLLSESKIKASPVLVHKLIAMKWPVENFLKTNSEIQKVFEGNSPMGSRDDILAWPLLSVSWCLRLGWPNTIKITWFTLNCK